MNRKAIGLVLASVLALMLVSSAGAVKHLVNVTNFSFSPQHIVVAPGDTVRWQWVGGIHTTTSDPSSPLAWFANLAGAGQRFDLPIRLQDGPGPFPGHCDIHPLQMFDTIFVSYGPKLHVIVVKDFEFFPHHTIVNPGDTVRWVLQGGTHTTTSDPSSFKQWNSPFLSVPGQTFDVVVNLSDGPGPFPYECSIHTTSMMDTIFVNYPSTVHHIQVSDFAFTPAKTHVNQGDTVIWAWKNGSHTSTSDPSSSKSWSSALLQAPGDNFKVTFTVADGFGPFPFHCEIHPLDMKDTIFVNGAPPACTCGDADGSGGTPDISDAVFLIAYIFGGGPAPGACGGNPSGLGDADASGGTPDISDAVFLIAYIFGGGPAPHCP